MHCDLATIVCLCTAAITAHSGCSSILLPQLNSCPLIYMPNLATIKIPRLLVNSLSLSRSTSHPWFVSSDNPAMWCRCLVNPSKICARRTLALSDVSTERRCVCVSQEPEAHWGPINPDNTWWVASRNTQTDATSRTPEWLKSKWKLYNVNTGWWLRFQLFQYLLLISFRNFATNTEMLTAILVERMK